MSSSGEVDLMAIENDSRSMDMPELPFHLGGGVKNEYLDYGPEDENDCSSVNDDDDDDSGKKGGKTRYKHVPHREKPVQVVQRRNARERRRVQTVNGAFSRLRKHIPYENRHKRLSKVKTLRIAIDYIHEMQKMLKDHDNIFDGLVAGGHVTNPEALQTTLGSGSHGQTAAHQPLQSIQEMHQSTPVTTYQELSMSPAMQTPVSNPITGPLFTGNQNFIDIMTSSNFHHPLYTTQPSDWSNHKDIQDFLHTAE